MIIIYTLFTLFSVFSCLVLYARLHMGLKRYKDTVRPLKRDLSNVVFLNDWR